jgi:hypothetical protein
MRRLLHSRYLLIAMVAVWVGWILWRIQAGWIIEAHYADGSWQRGGFDIRVPPTLKVLTLILLTLGILNLRRASKLALGIAEGLVGIATGVLAAVTDQFNLAVWIALLGAGFFVVSGYDKIEEGMHEKRARRSADSVS